MTVGLSLPNGGVVALADVPALPASEFRRNRLMYTYRHPRCDTAGAFGGGRHASTTGYLCGRAAGPFDQSRHPHAD